MTKKYYLLTLCVLFLSFIGASAQDNGYYRLQNVASEHIAQLSGHTHVAPSATLEQAVVLPGTIAYTAVENNHFTALTIQNVDLVNQVIPMVKDIAANLFDEEQFASLKDTLEHYVLSYMSANVADLVVPLIRKYTYQDFQKYIANALGAGIEAYLLEYTRDEKLKQKIITYCEASGAGYYISEDVDL